MRRLRTGMSGTSGRAAIGAIGLAACAPLLTGCFYLSPAQTAASYDGGVGAHTTIGGLEFANLMIVSKAKDSQGAMHGQVTNNSAAAVPLTVVVGGQTAQVSIPADSAIRLDGKPSGNTEKTIKAIDIAKTPAQPGASVSVTFSVPGSGQNPVDVPVLNPQQAYTG